MSRLRNGEALENLSNQRRANCSRQRQLFGHTSASFLHRRARLRFSTSSRRSSRHVGRKRYVVQRVFPLASPLCLRSNEVPIARQRVQPLSSRGRRARTERGRRGPGGRMGTSPKLHHTKTILSGYE